jgi:hypothetical protein
MPAGSPPARRLVLGGVVEARGVDAVCGFVGRNQARTMEENLIDFEEGFLPLLREAKTRGLTYRVEQCPMPGWSSADHFVNNIGYVPALWIALHQIAEKHGLGDQFRVHYDPSHSILMGQDTRSMFQYLKDEGYPFLIGGMHVKGQVVDAKGVAGWGYQGQTVQRGDWADGQVSPNPADLLNSWKKQTVLCEHELPGTARHDPLAYLQNRTVDWLDHQLAARELLDYDVATTPLIVEHNGRTQVVTNGANRVRSYDLETGKLIWQCGGQSDNPIPSPVAGGGMVFVTSGFRGNKLEAIRLAEARGNVALYLMLTVAPFAVIGPTLGRVLDRAPVATRAALVAAAIGRAILALALLGRLDSLWLFPAAFGLLVLSRVHGITRNSLLPLALDEPHALVAANARLAWISMLAGGLAGLLFSLSQQALYRAAAEVQELYLAGDKRGAAAAIPTRLIEDIALIGPAEKIRDELDRWRETVVTTLLVRGDAAMLRKVADALS